MADVSVQMGVSGVGQFKSAMNEASASVKMLDTALKMNEQQLKSTGDKETYLQNKMVTLKAQIEAQTKVVKNAEQAWKTLLENGADPMSKAVVEMQSKYYAANTALMQMTDSLKALESGETQAAAKADKLGSSLGGLNRTVSLEAVINGVNRITTGLENAGKKAVQLGKTIWDELMDRAQWADDSATMALMYGVDLETFLKVQKLVQNGMDTSVEAILKSQSKLKKNVGSGSDSFMETMKELGLAVTEYGGKVEDGITRLVTQDSVDLFWKAGQALMNLGDEYEQEAKAQEIFGKSWRELVPLFEKYKTREEYQAALESTITNTEDEVSALADLNDKVGELKGNFDTLETKVLAGLAPALTKAADALSGLLGSVLDYLDTPAGQQALKDMETAVSGLFSDLSKIDPEDVVESFKTVFDDIVGGLQWLTNNSGTVIGALKAIIVGWGGLQLTGGALQVLQLINGLKNFKGIPSDVATSGGGNAAGGGWGSAITTALTTAITKGVNWLGAGGLSSLPFISEWFMHGTHAGQTLTNGGSVFDMFRTIGSDAQQWWSDTQGRAGTFLGDWLGVLENIFGGYGAKHSASNSGILGQPGDLMKSWDAWFGPAPVEIEPEVPEDAAEQISRHIGVVRIGTELVPISLSGGTGGGGGSRLGGYLAEHANGLPYVPFDGYHAILHKGERVVTAREMNNSRNYSSNLYVENMNMNGGASAEGLAAAMAAAQQRTMRAYGS